MIDLAGGFTIWAAPGAGMERALWPSTRRSKLRVRPSDGLLTASPKQRRSSAAR